MAPTAWSQARDRWLAAATEVLAADPAVERVDLVGSFGRGDADAWSDVDLLVVVADDAFDDWTERNELWDSAACVVPAPQNTRATAWSVGTTHVVDGFPVGVDWYVCRRAEAAEPVDGATFDAWNAEGPRGTPRTFTADELRVAHAAMTTIAGKRVARGIDPPSRLADLEELVRRDASPSLQRPLLRYLAEVRRHIEQDGEPRAR